MTASRVLVTGARGLVGEALVFRLMVDQKHIPVAAVRGVTRLSGLCSVLPLELTASADLPDFTHIDVVVHAAARVHVMRENVTDVMEAFRKVNVEGTVRLALAAAAAGVKRFIFISSIKVNGESTLAGKAFQADDLPYPEDAYAISKYEAEQRLRQIGQETGMEIVIIRPPLVYGPGVKANFLTMLKFVGKNIPLPLGMIKNRRSFVSIYNLTDFIVTCIDHPGAANNTFLVSDDCDVSTTKLMRLLASAMKKKSRLVPVPSVLLKTAGMLLCKRAVVHRVCDSLQVDINKNRILLGWSPPVNIEVAIQRTVHFYQEKR